MRTVQYIVKVSKLCNLRCKYCYEMPELGNPERMSLEQLDRMYTHLADHYGSLEEPIRIVFVWHGGEPLLQSPDLYWATFARQQEIFGAGGRVVVENVVQSNLTVLDEERIRLLREGFKGVGVSIDLFGGLRVNLAQRDSQARVLANIDKLRAARVPFGGITVLTQRNLKQVTKIFRFYERMNMNFRILPLFPGAFEDQHAEYAITPDEVLEALCTLADLWLESDRNIQITPLVGHFQEAIKHLQGDSLPVYYNRREWETAVMVNTNGDVFGYPEAYDPAFCYGNIFTTSMSALLASENREKSLKGSELRMAGACAQCPYFGSCSGFYMAEESPEGGSAGPQGVAMCHVEQRLIRHIEARLKQTGLFAGSKQLDQQWMRAKHLDGPVEENASLGVLA
ncbi:putative oxidoreductase [Chondromyces apiculatus DSM 436]|uniref:Putative oxidoreductase n=2 Tax=Chondromyces apiculatus TaxID=51 RepID=A0A017TFL3_9BACT|nr:putative oxidoreductase [Chondromyces apiculatus DSM 436]